MILRTFGSLDSEEKEEIVERNMVRSIHQLHLLKTETSEFNNEFGAFVKEHFPLSWSIAEKMSDEEIRMMIEEWRKSVQ